MKLNKKNIVVVMDTYFPDSRATTHIMQRILEQLSGLYEIYVFTLNLFNHTFEELPSQHNGIHISYADLPTKNLFLKIMSKFAVLAYKVKYKTTYQYAKLYIFSKQIEQLMNETGAKTLISVSTPTDIHICAEMALKGSGYPEWIPVCFDPHAYNSDYSPALRESFKKEELILYAKAKRIFMVSQSKKDYADNPLKEKITFFELPTEFFDPLPNPMQPQELGSDKPIKIMYIGNIYNSKRNPDYMLTLFSKVKEPNFDFNIVGAFSGYGDNLAKYQKKWTEQFDGSVHTHPL